ncbi:hypothetical protein K1719_000373 [Acacia pycnantha]|nr:hypothetical protein K1719_000373 [Acacia pycnantha]
MLKEHASFPKEEITTSNSKHGCLRRRLLDPREKAKSETRDWLNNVLLQWSALLDGDQDWRFRDGEGRGYGRRFDELISSPVCNVGTLYHMVSAMYEFPDYQIAGINCTKTRAYRPSKEDMETTTAIEGGIIE